MGFGHIQGEELSSGNAAWAGSCARSSGRECLVMGVWLSLHLDGISAPGQDRVPQDPAWVGKQWGCKLSRFLKLEQGLLWLLLTSGLGHSLCGRPGHWGEFSSTPDPHPLPSCDNHRFSQMSACVPWGRVTPLPYRLEVAPTNEPQAATCAGDRDPSEDVFRVPGARGPECQEAKPQAPRGWVR